MSGSQGASARKKARVLTGNPDFQGIDEAVMLG